MSSKSSSKKQQQQQQRKGGEFLCKIRYKNPLPELPFSAKLLSHPIDESKLADYEFSDWEKRVTFPLVTEWDLGMPFDLIDIEAYNLPYPSNAQLEPEDEILLQPPPATDVDGELQAGRYRPSVPWLRRTEYISSEARLAKRGRGENVELQRLQQQIRDNPELFDVSRESQLIAIEKSFESAQEWENSLKKKHPTKPDVYPEQILPIFPDFEHFTNTFTHCIFDDDPSPKSAFSNALEVDENQNNLENSLMKVFQGGSGNSNDQFIVFFYPTGKRSADEMEMESEYPNHFEAVRQYTFEMTKYNTLEKVLFEFSNEQVSFSSVSGRFAMRKRRGAALKRKSRMSNQMDTDDPIIPTDITLVTRSETSEEEKKKAETRDSVFGLSR